MKITIVQGAFLPVPALRGGAVEKVWFALGQEFARRGHSVTHLSRAYSGLPHEEIIEGVHHIRVRGFDTPRSLMVLKGLDFLYSWRVVRRLLPADILVTNTFWLPILARSERTGKLYVHVARHPKGQMRLYRHAARLQTVSQPIQSAIIDEVPDCAAKVRSIGYPLSDAPLTPHANGPMLRKPHLLYAGRIHPEKGIHLLVEAIARLRANGAQEWKLVLVGPWETSAGGGGSRYFKELKRLAESARDYVEFVGPVFEPERLAEFYRAASLFAYPSLAEKGETFGLAPLEAMSHGCPVLVSDLACFRDFVRDEENGFVFNHRVAAPGLELASKLQGLLSRPARIEEARPHATATAQRFSLDRIAGLYLNDFASLVEKERPASLVAEAGPAI